MLDIIVTPFKSVTESLKNSMACKSPQFILKARALLCALWRHSFMRLSLASQSELAEIDKGPTAALNFLMSHNLRINF